MKKTYYLLTLCFLFTGFLAVNSSAQETPSMPENFLVIEEFVEPANMHAFWQTQQKAVDLWKKYEFDLTLYTYRTDKSSFYWVVPIQNFAGLDEVFKKANEMTSKMKENGYDGDKEFRELSTARETVLHWSKDLSYHPNGMPSQVDNPYCEWTFVSLLSGHEKEAAEAVKKYIAFYDSIEESDNWDTYSVSLGFDTPMWIFMWRAESELAMRQHEKELRDKYSDKFSELWKEFRQHIRKVDNIKGRFLPDWSLNLPK